MADSSGKWPPEAMRMFIELLRAYSRLDADYRFLAALLVAAETNEQPPYKWLDALKQARNTPEYRKISEQFEPLFHELEQSLDESDAARLLESILSTSLPN